MSGKKNGSKNSESNSSSVRASGSSNRAQSSSIRNGKESFDPQNTKIQPSVNSSESKRQQKRPSGEETDFSLSLIDPVNKVIIGLLEQNPFLSQIEIAKQLGLSQSSIALRLDKLRRSGILTDLAGVNLKLLGLETCRVDADCSDGRELLEWSKSCPLSLNGTVGVGGTNVSLYFAAEDIEMFQYIVDEHVRRLKGVYSVHFSPIVSWAREFVAPLKLDIPKNNDPPCGFMYSTCHKCDENIEANAPDLPSRVAFGLVHPSLISSSFKTI